MQWAEHQLDFGYLQMSYEKWRKLSRKQTEYFNFLCEIQLDHPKQLEQVSAVCTLLILKHNTDRWVDPIMTAFFAQSLLLSRCYLEMICSPSANSLLPTYGQRWRFILVRRGAALTNLDCALACFLQVPLRWVLQAQQVLKAHFWKRGVRGRFVLTLDNAE